MALGDGVSALATLTVGFGGFSPTAFDAVEASKRQIAHADSVRARMREMQERRRELERARTSKPRTRIDAVGTKWTYVIIDNRFARIAACETAASLLRIPDAIDGYPVYAIAPDACARLESVESVVCPDSVEVIGACAFRLCPNLRSIVFPENVADFSASWLSHCPSLRELVLPGLLETVTSAVFDNEGITRLRIGRNVKTIVPGAFEKTQLKALEIHPGNPYLHSDGTALYSADGKVLIVLGKPVAHYDIAEGCEKVAKKAFCNIHTLQSATLPATLKVVGKFAFAHSALTSIDVPENVRVIGEKAFYCCRELAHVRLREGLARIDDSAFEETAIRELRIPASIDRIGSSIVKNTQVVASGEHATIVIDPGSTSLFLDGSGGLYRRQDDGVHLVQLIDEQAREFTAHPGTRVVDERAFAFHDAIRSVAFSEGLEEICDDAFRVCANLRMAALPDSLRSIGANAFLDTRLSALRVPASLESIGENALVTAGAHRMGEPPELASVEVAPGNGRFYVHDGMLCERTDRGSRIIVFSGGREDVAIPPEVTSIVAYAFSNARGIRTLRIPATLKTIGTAGLGVWCLIEEIHVDVPAPIEGRSSFDFRFPATDRSIHSISLALGGSAWVNVPDIMAQYDNCIANAHDYRGNDRDSISIYEQVTRVIERLRDPILLTNVNRKNFDRLLRGHLTEICVDIARHDDRQAIDALLDFGYLNEGNLEQVIAAVTRLQDAAMTAYLLEVKRRRFRRQAFDFDL